VDGDGHSAEAHVVAGAQLGMRNAGTAHQRAVARAQIFDLDVTIAVAEARMLARDGHVLDHEVRGRRSTDEDGVTLAQLDQTGVVVRVDHHGRTRLARGPEVGETNGVTLDGRPIVALVAHPTT
jgi:hypothetical protein